MLMIPEEEACRLLRGHTWLVSHGGVASEALARFLDIEYPKGKSSTSNRPIRGVVCHFPYPLPTGPDRAIYVYGSLFESIVSQHPRHPDNAAKLHNDEHYPRFYRVDDLLAFDHPDPFGVAAQFESFRTAEVDYPILMVKYTELEASMPAICEFLGIEHRRWVTRPRRSSLDLLPTTTLQKLHRLYGETRARMEAMPALVEIPPKSGLAAITSAPESGEPRLMSAAVGLRTVAGPSTTVDAGGPATSATSSSERSGAAGVPTGTPASAELVTAWTDLAFPARRLVDERLEQLCPGARQAAVRVKQPALLLAETSRLFLNLRYDFTNTAGQAYLCAWRICPETFRPLDTGELVEVPHPGEGRSDGRFGPEDQRVVRLGDETLLVFNMLLENGERRMFLHRFERGITIELALEGRSMQRIEKNWMPFVTAGELRFVYRVDPLTIIRCVDLERGSCEVVCDEDPHDDSVHGRGEISLHGGTELEPWRGALMVGLVHSCAPWRSMLCVLDSVANRWAYIGPMFDLPKPALPEAEEWRGKSVQFPASVELVQGAMLVGIEYEDRCPALVRLPLDFIDDALQLTLDR